MIKKPDMYVVGSSQKGLSLKYWEAWVGAHNNDERGEKPDMSIVTAWTTESWFRRCVDILSSTIAGIPWEITRGDTVLLKSNEEAPSDWEWFDVEDYLYRSAASLATTGASYFQKEGMLNDDMEFRTLSNITGLKYYKPTTISPVYERGDYGPDDYGNFRYFKRIVDSREFYISRRAVLHTFQPDPFTEQGPGSSDGMAAREQAQILYDLSGFTSDQLRSGLPKKTVFVADKDARQPSEDQLKKWQRWIQRYLLGAKGTPPEVMQGLDTKEIGSDLSSLHSSEITKDAREAVSSAFGIPHSLIMSNAANFATAQADQLNFYITKALPQARVITNALNRQLLAPLGFRFTMKPERLEVFQSYELEKGQTLVALTGGKPVLTQDEARERVEEDPLGYDSLDPLRITDVKNWRKAIKNRGRDYDFSPDALNESEASVIRERLSCGKSLDEAFAPPFVGF